MGGYRVDGDLARAAADGRLVEIVRRRGWDVVTGSVVQLGRKWVLVATVAQAGFDGHALVRRSDVRRVDEVGYPESFFRRALAAEGHWPLPGLDRMRLSTTKAVVRSSSNSAPMIAVFYERLNPDDCRIGVPHHSRKRSFKLQLVTTAAEWDRSTTFRYRQVSRIDVGDTYQQRLAAVAGERPHPSVSNATYARVKAGSRSRPRSARLCPP